MADKYQREAIRSLHKYGFAVRADPTERYATSGENGRADLLAARAGRGVYIECKTGGLSFQFSEWRPNQREWWQKYCIPEPYSMELYIWLWMGEHPANYNPLKYNPRRAWLIPAKKFLEVEKMVSAVQGSLVYKAGKGYSTQLQENRWDAVTLLKDFEVQYKSGLWGIEPVHPFYVAYIQPQPLPMYQQEREIA